MIPRFCAWTGWSSVRILPPHHLAFGLSPPSDYHPSDYHPSDYHPSDYHPSGLPPFGLPPLRIAQSEALRIDGRESAAKPRPQSFALRNPKGGNPANRSKTMRSRGRRAAFCAIRRGVIRQTEAKPCKAPAAELRSAQSGMGEESNDKKGARRKPGPSSCGGVEPRS
jgi:hypothetical protein